MKLSFVAVFAIHEVPSSVTSMAPQREAADAEIKAPSVGNTELTGSPLKPAVGYWIPIHAMLTARDFFRTNFYPSGPFTCSVCKTSLKFFLC